MNEGADRNKRDRRRSTTKKKKRESKETEEGDSKYCSLQKRQTKETANDIIKETDKELAMMAQLRF